MATTASGTSGPWRATVLRRGWESIALRARPPRNDATRCTVSRFSMGPCRDDAADVPAPSGSAKLPLHARLIVSANNDRAAVVQEYEQAMLTTSDELTHPS